MPCKEIRMPDGTVILAKVKPGQKLTEKDKTVLAEWVEFVRARARKEQRARNKKGNPRADPS